MENDYLRKIDFLYQLTAIDNLASIFEFGLLSHNDIIQRDIPHRDIADPEVQRKRHSKPDLIYRRSLHDYVCLYFSPRNPMLFVRNEWQNDIIILGIEKQLLWEPGTIFTDGNAASDNTRFYSNAADLEQLDWEILQAKYWNDDPDGKRKKCAEILIYPMIEARYIRRVFCASAEQYHRVWAVLAPYQKQSIVLAKPQFFFRI